MKKRDYFLLLGIIILLFLSGSLASAPSSISPASQSHSVFCNVYDSFIMLLLNI
ncbi:unnamed protein product [Brassica oleracea var. botrytis]